jgi:uncharacterized cysteine cluster protein YcgN (CxxCxxCC family)
MIEVTEALYEASIPEECSYRTLKDHLEMMLCWGLVSSIEQGKKMNCGSCCENLSNERKRNEVQSTKAR